MFRLQIKNSRVSDWIASIDGHEYNSSDDSDDGFNKKIAKPKRLDVESSVTFEGII